MSKALILAGALAATGATAAAITFYVSPAALSDTDVPPVRVNAPVADTMAKLERMTAESFLMQQSGRREYWPSYIRMVTAKEGDRQVRFTVRLGSDLVFEAEAFVSEIDANQSEVDVRVSLPDSKFSQHPDLHPYDIIAMETLADQFITEYVNSVLNARRMASEKELEKELARRLGFSEGQARAFADRVKIAFEQSYGPDLKRVAEAEEERRSARPGGYGDWRFGEPLDQQDDRYPMREYVDSVPAQDAAQAASDAAADAVAEAESAADAAAAAADAAASAAGAYQR